MIIQNLKLKNGEVMIAFSVFNYLIAKGVRFSEKAFQTVTT